MELPAEAVRRLDETSRGPLGFPHDFLRTEGVTQIVYGDKWREVDDRRSTVRRTPNDA